MATARVPLLDLTGHLPESYAPPSVAIDAQTATDAAAAALASEGAAAESEANAGQAKTDAEAARDLALGYRDDAEGYAGTAAIDAQTATTKAAEALDSANDAAGVLAGALQTGGGLVTAAGVIVGDGVANDGPALNALFAAAAGKVVIIPAGMTVRTTSTLTPASGTTVVAHGARFVCDTAGASAELLGINGVTAVTIIGGTWDGNKDAYGGTSDQRHAINVAGSSHIVITDATVTGAQGDGIYIGDQITPSSYITLARIRSYAHRRNGLTLTAVTHFADTESTYEGQSGQHPMAGLDIEANLADVVVDDVTFTGCRFAGNDQYGIIISQPNIATARQGGITFIGCSFDSNGGTVPGVNGNYGMRLHNATNVRFIGGQIRGNLTNGVMLTGTTGRDITFDAVEISANGGYGLYVPASTPVERLAMNGCIIRDNSATTPGAADGIWLESGTKLSIIGCISTGANQRYGLRTSAAVTYLTAVANNFANNGTADVSLADDTATRLALGRLTSAFATPTITGNVVVSDGSVAGSRAAAGDTAYSATIIGEAQPRLLIRADGDMRFGDGASAGDTRLYRSAADTLRTTDTFIADAGLQTAAAISSTATGGTGYLELREQSADPATQADRGRLFVKDNGSGKSQLCVRLGVGAVQIIATEP